MALQSIPTSRSINAAESRVHGIPGAQVWVPRGSITSLSRLGYRLSFGIPKGTLLHLRKQNPDGSGYHVRAYPGGYMVEWDQVDPQTDLGEHLRRDMKGRDWLELAFWVGLGAAVASTSD